MSGAEEPEARGIAAAAAALAQGDPDAARALLQPCLGEPVDAGAYQLLGAVEYFDDNFADARRAWEQAFTAYRGAGQLKLAARVALDLASLHSNSLGNDAAGRGWVGRARRLLEAVGPCVEWGWFELALMACDRPDIEDLERSTERALQIALEFGDGDLEVQALADSGLALVTRGRTAEGFARLDEALAAITAGEVRDLMVAGKCFCAMLSSCDRAGDVQRAEEWTRLVDDAVLRPLEGRPKVLHTHCRAAYGSVLCSVGRWPEAEAVMLEALGPGASATYGHRVETVAHLAELRVQQGRLDEAAEWLAPFEDSLVVAGALARLHLACGRSEVAAATARRAVNVRVGDVLRGGPLLGIVVEASLASGDIDAAARASDELAAVARTAQSTAVAAEAALAAARVACARGAAAEAIEHYDHARHLLARGERPFVSGLVAIELAELHAAAGDEAAAVSEARAARAAFDRLGACGYVDRADAVLRGLGARGGPRKAGASSAIASLTRREAEVLELVRQGLSNSEIAARLFISTKTAEHHVSRVLAKLGAKTRSEAAAVATAAAGK